MPNPNPYRARLGKKRRGKAGNLQETQKVLWAAICAAEDQLADTDPELVLRACHAICQCCSAYIRMVEATELQARLEALEAKVAAQEAQHAKSS